MKQNKSETTSRTTNSQIYPQLTPTRLSGTWICRGHQQLSNFKNGTLCYTTGTHVSQVRDGWETTEVNWTILKFSELFLVGCDLSMLVSLLCNASLKFPIFLMCLSFLLIIEQCSSSLFGCGYKIHIKIFSLSYPRRVLFFWYCHVLCPYPHA